MSRRVLILLAATVGLAVGGVRSVSAQPVEELRLEGPGGRVVRGLAAGPGDARAAVLLLHDWFGITEATLDAARRIAGLGYRVLVLDLYDGERAADHDKARELSGGLEAAEVRAKLETALATLREWRAERVVTLGFSMGGNPAFSAARLGGDLIRGAAVVYGGGMENLTDEQLASLGFPLLLITGSDDAWPMTTVQALLPRMVEVGGALEVYVYPQARHGFAQPLYAGGDNLDPAAIEATWAVLENFLQRRLEG